MKKGKGLGIRDWGLGKIIFSFILMLTLSGCKTLKNTSGSESEQARPEQTIFHNFLAVNNNGTIIIAEKDKLLRDGRIKVIRKDPYGMLYPVEISFLNDKNRELNKMFIEHPLIDVLEYAGDDDQIKSITLFKDSATFTIRYNSLKELDRITFSTVNVDTLNISTQLILRK